MSKNTMIRCDDCASPVPEETITWVKKISSRYMSVGRGQTHRRMAYCKQCVRDHKVTITPMTNPEPASKYFIHLTMPNGDVIESYGIKQRINYAYARDFVDHVNQTLKEWEKKHAEQKT